MSDYDRQTKERDIVQGIEEEVVYTLTTTPWGSTPIGVSVKAYDMSDYSDVSATVLSGSPSVSGDVITLPILESLTAGGMYRIEIQFTAGGNVFEAWFEVVAER